ncbi:hypothetical protein PYCC9005_002837 [Savitreella phatthalungensis]
MSSNTASTRYPTRDQIEAIFKPMESGDFPKTLEHVDPNVDWTVMGTHPCAGNYKTLADFKTKTLDRLGKIMKPPGISLRVRNVIGGGDQDWAVVELIAAAECKSGLKFDNTYAWVVRFNDQHKVVQVRAYLDSWMVKQAIEENEAPSHRAPIPEI